MKKHNHYYEISASSYQDMGRKIGSQFAKEIREQILYCKNVPNWSRRLQASLPLLEQTKNIFPQYIEEAQGMAQGALVDFLDLWCVSVEDELEFFEKCTTVVTNDGALIAHNEDWDEESEDSVVILRRKMGDFQSLELYYIGTLGGNSISVNSHGVVHAINSLHHSDHQVGVPRNVIARWASESRSLAEPRVEQAWLESFTNLQRSSGYHHFLISKSASTVPYSCISIESSAKKTFSTAPSLPTAHSNHFLSFLRSRDEDDGGCGSTQRHARAMELCKSAMTTEEGQQLLRDRKGFPDYSLFNERTIASIVINLEESQFLVWLKRESEAGWVSYSI